MARSIIILLAAVAVAQSIYFYPQMPEVMASHFSGGGTPDGWMTRDLFIAFYLGMVALIIVIFILIPKFPNQLRNIPNRNYWMEEERKADTMDYIDKAALRMGIATMALMVFVMQYAFEANLKQEPRLSGDVGWALVLYFLFLGVWLVKFLKRFWTIPDQSR